MKCTFGGKKRVNYHKFEIATNCVNQIFNLNAFFFFLLTGATWYYHTIYLLFTYFASFTDYEDDIFEIIYNLAEKFTNLVKFFLKVELHGQGSRKVMSAISGLHPNWNLCIQFDAKIYALFCRKMGNVAFYAFLV